MNHAGIDAAECPANFRIVRTQDLQFARVNDDARMQIDAHFVFTFLLRQVADAMRQVAAPSGADIADHAAKVLADRLQGRNGS